MKGKFCWMAREYSRGWRLSLCIGKKTRWMSFWFRNIEDIKHVLKGGIVFVHMRGGK